MIYLGINEVYKSVSYLEHYGVPGMKWGVRKEYEKVGTSSRRNIGKTYQNITYDHNEKTDREDTNPKYGVDRAASYNCAYCSIAYDMRRRGYDVQALTAFSELTPGSLRQLYVNKKTGQAPKGNNYLDISTMSESKKRDVCSNFKSTCLSCGEGARGGFSVYWSAGSGHSMIWEVRNGEVVIIDAQSNQESKIEDYIDKVTDIFSFRMDDCDLNLDKANQYLKNGNKVKNPSKVYGKVRYKTAMTRAKIGSKKKDIEKESSNNRVSRKVDKKRGKNK